jgi:hypothetical protein
MVNMEKWFRDGGGGMFFVKPSISPHGMFSLLATEDLAIDETVRDRLRDRLMVRVGVWVRVWIRVWVRVRVRFIIALTLALTIIRRYYQFR